MESRAAVGDQHGYCVLAQTDGLGTSQMAVSSSNLVLFDMHISLLDGGIDAQYRDTGWFGSWGVVDDFAFVAGFIMIFYFVGGALREHNKRVFRKRGHFTCARIPAKITSHYLSTTSDFEGPVAFQKMKRTWELFKSESSYDRAKELYIKMDEIRGHILDGREWRDKLSVLSDTTSWYQKG